MMLNASIMTVEKPGRAHGREHLTAQRAFGAEQAAQARKAVAWLAGSAASGSSRLVGAMAGDGGAAGEAIGVEIDCNNDAGAEGARRRDRDRIDQRAIDQPAPAKPHRRENAGERIGGAQRQREHASRQPDFVTGADLGRDRGETHRQIFDRVLPIACSSRSRQPAAADQAGTADADVEIAEDAAQRQGARPDLQLIELAVRIAAADQRAHRGADDDVGNDAVLAQGVDDADMGKAARRAAAEDEADRGPPAACRNNNGFSPDCPRYSLHPRSLPGEAACPTSRLPSRPLHDQPGKNRNKLLALI